MQVEYSLIERTVEREMVPMAKAMGLGVTAWSPLTGGWLSGKHGGGAKSGGRLDDEQLRGNFLEINDRAQAIVREVAAIGTELGRSSTQVALAWLRHREVPVIPIIGTRKLAQLKDNLASVEVKLGGDHLARLDRVSRIEMGYAHSFFEKDLVRAFSTGGMGQLTDRP